MDSGYIIVQTFTAQKIIPVENAKVIISQTNKADKTFLTNDSGQTDIAEIETPDKINSETPENTEIPFSTVDVSIEKEGFFSVVIKNVQIFPGITTLQYVNVIPIPEFDSDKTIGIQVIPQNL